MNFDENTAADSCSKKQRSTGVIWNSHFEKNFKN